MCTKGWQRAAGSHDHTPSARITRQRYVLANANNSYARGAPVHHAFINIPRMTHMRVGRSTHMARITDAQKVEVLRSITVEEYGTEMSFTRSLDGAATISLRIADPRRTERDQTIAYLNGLRENVLDTEYDERTIMAIVEYLDGINERDVEKYGDHKGEPVKFGTSMYLNPEIADVIVNTLDTNQLDYTVSKTIRDSFSTGDTRGF